jgi:hypothetical protein
MYAQLGTYIDYYTGEYKLGLSETLIDALLSQDWEKNSSISLHVQVHMAELIPKKQHALFPQLLVANWDSNANFNSKFPPALLCHGDADGAIMLSESRGAHP